MDINDSADCAMMQHEKSSQAVIQFNERWKRLEAIQDDIAENFINELLGNLSNDDNDELMSHVEDILTWKKDMNERLDLAENKHLSEYAKDLKETAMLAIKLCQKYEIYNDIKSFQYHGSRQIIELNGESLYFFG